VYIQDTRYKIVMRQREKGSLEGKALSMQVPPLSLTYPFKTLVNRRKDPVYVTCKAIYTYQYNVSSDAWLLPDVAVSLGGVVAANAPSVIR